MEGVDVQRSMLSEWIGKPAGKRRVIDFSASACESNSGLSHSREDMRGARGFLLCMIAE